MGARTPRIVWQLVFRTVLAVAVAYAAAKWYTGRLPDTFRARALLLLTPTPFEYGDKQAGIVERGGEGAERLSFLRVSSIQSLSMPDYRLLFTSESMALDLAERLRQKYEENNIPTSELSPERLLGMLDLRHKTLVSANDRTIYQQVVELYVTAPRPAQAALVANAWAEACTAMAAKIRAVATEGAAAPLRAQVERIEADFAAASRELSDLEIRAAAFENLRAPDPTLAEQRDIARERRDALAASLRQLRTGLTAVEVVTTPGVPEFKIVSEALPPSGPAGPQRSALLLAAVVLAAIAAPLHLFTMAAIRRYAALYEARREV